MPTTILHKNYIGEDLKDMQRDIHEMFDSRINPIVDKCKTDEHGIHTGSFRVIVSWCGDDECRCIGFEHHPDCKLHWTNCGGDPPF